MGLLEQLAAAAIRKNVISSLRSACPDELKEPLEKLLADTPAVNAIQGLVMGAMKDPSLLSRDAFASLPLEPATADLLNNTPGLINFLRRTALSKLKK